MKAARAVVIVMAASALLGCQKARNYTDPTGPRYVGGIASPDPDPILKVVTFNIRYARHVDRAREVFESDGTTCSCAACAPARRRARASRSRTTGPAITCPSGRTCWSPAALERRLSRRL